MKNDTLQPVRQVRQSQASDLVQEVVRPHRKKLSRYKLKKQVGLAENILNDLQIMNV